MNGSGGKWVPRGFQPPWTPGEKMGEGKGTSGTASPCSQVKGKSSKGSKKGGKGSKGTPSLPSVGNDGKGDQPWPKDGKGYRAQLEQEVRRFGGGVAPQNDLSPRAQQDPPQEGTGEKGGAKSSPSGGMPGVPRNLPTYSAHGATNEPLTEEEAERLVLAAERTLRRSDRSSRRTVTFLTAK